MANRKNSHRRRVRVAVLMVLCGAVFAAFFARLAWMQFVRADYYADKAAEASSASYTVTQHAARGAIVDSAGVVLARDTTVYDVYLRIPAPPEFGPVRIRSASKDDRLIVQPVGAGDVADPVDQGDVRRDVRRRKPSDLAVRRNP